MAAVLAPGSTVQELSNALPLLGFGYLATAALRRRQATWVVVVVGVAAVAALRLQDWADPLVVVLGAALVIVAWGGVGGRLWRSRALMLETAGMVGFTAVSLVALSVDQDLGRYVVAAGWVGHGVWDVAHYRAEMVVLRLTRFDGQVSYAARGA